MSTPYKVSQTRKNPLLKGWQFDEPIFQRQSFMPSTEKNYQFASPKTKTIDLEGVEVAATRPEAPVRKTSPGITAPKVPNYKVSPASTLPSGTNAVIESAKLKAEANPAAKVDDAKKRFVVKNPVEKATAAYAALSGLTNKEPKMPKPKHVEPIVRPVLDQTEMVANANTNITRSKSSAINDLKKTVGANTGAYVVGRALVGSNEAQARSEVDAKNAEMKMADTNRMYDELNKAKYLNNEMDNRFAQGKYEVDMQRFAQRNALAQGMLQNSVNTIAQKNAVSKENEQAKKIADQRMRWMALSSLYEENYRRKKEGQEMTPQEKEEYIKNFMDFAYGDASKMPNFRMGGRTDYAFLRANAERNLSDANKMLRQMADNYVKYIFSASKDSIKDFNEKIRDVNRSMLTKRYSIKTR